MEYQQILEEQFNNIIDQYSMDSLSEGASELTNGISNEFSIEYILNSMINGSNIFENPILIDSLKSLFLLEIKYAFLLCSQILVICIVIGILKGMSDSFKIKSVSEISMMVCNMIIIGLSIGSLKSAYYLALDSVNTMSDTMLILMPILIGILIATGAVTSGTILSPMIIGTITGATIIVKTFILPMLFIAAILSLINCLTEKDYVNKLSKVIRTIGITMMGLILIILTGVINIQGLLSNTSDNILINTAKFSLSNFIPIVGGFTSDTVELFIKCMSSIKNIVGVFGIILIILLLLIPLIKILIVSLIYKLTAALAEPISDSKISKGLYEMGDCLMSIGSILLFTSLLFVMFITTIIKLGGS